ncbi:MAG: hypothetical protein CME88_09290 [Hirschia sp.]|nr:hypothetical protein [Hirschia sp.]MBF18558.1 hypothetical protein [Hirschia sp.]|tara:strand:- start:581 stop:1312 length:732 start_codon:yes stop_codon:yes gene_type:complete
MTTSRRVLVTRAMPGANATAGRLKEAGLSPVVLPLLQLRPLHISESQANTLSDFEADLIFTSANGIRFAPGDLAGRAQRVWCAGDATAEAARNAGYDNVISAHGTARDLIELIQNECDPRLVSFIHLGHSHPRGHIVETLDGLGFQAEHIPIYGAQPTPRYASRLGNEIEGKSAIDVVMIHSPAAGQRFADLWKENDLSQIVTGLIATISEAAAEPLRPFAGRRIKVAERPNETALIGLIQTG